MVTRDNLCSPSLIGFFCISIVVIYLELFLIRSSSVILWNHLTPLIISIVFFGFGLSGLVTSFLMKNEKIKVKIESNKVFNSTLSFWGSLLLSLFIPVAFIVFTHIPLLNAASFRLGMLAWVVLLIALSCPFIICGFLISLGLSSAKERTFSYYGANLIGSAIGGLLYVLSISTLEASRIIFLISLVSIVAAWFFSTKKRQVLHKSLCIVLFCFFSIITIFFNENLPVKGPGGKRAFERQKSDILFTGWNAISRIDVLKQDSSSSKNLTVLIDGGSATTYIPIIDKGLELENPNNVRSSNPLLHRFFVNPDVLVVGSGGGVDVRDFLVNNAASVTAVEINPLLNRLVLQDFAEITSNLYKDPRVDVLTMDARSYLASSNKIFDIIHIGLPVTNAAVASGSVNLLENTLLTKEALVSYRLHLKENGLIYFLYSEIAALRIVATMDNILIDRELLQNSFVVLSYPSNRYSQGDLSSRRVELFVKKKPFTEKELEKIVTFANKMGMNLHYIPGLDGNSYFHKFIKNEISENDLALIPNIIKPSLDDRPFINHFISWRSLIQFVLFKNKTLDIFGHWLLDSEQYLLYSFFILMFLVFTFIVLGVLVLRDRVSKIRLKRYYFASFLIGLGFIFVELNLLNSFRLLWGAPEIASISVISLLLISAGVGSMVFKYFKKIRGIFIIISLIFLLGLGGFYFEHASVFILKLDLIWKVIASYGPIMIMGFLLGLPMPILLYRLSIVSSYTIGFNWAINIFASSLGALVGFMVAMDYGYSSLLFLSLTCYFIVFLLFLFLDKE